MEFTEENIKRFINKLICDIDLMINRATLNLFDDFTRYALMDTRWGEEYDANVHYFNAWKTNEGYKVADKVIVPFYNRISFGPKKLDWEQKALLEDLHKVFSYYSIKQSKEKISETVEKFLQQGQNRKIETDYFFISIFKKGTIHIEFKEKDALRRFNIEACKGKNFLPMDYSEKDFENLDDKDKDLVNSFETLKTYKVIKNGKHFFYSHLEGTKFLDILK